MELLLRRPSRLPAADVLRALSSHSPQLTMHYLEVALASGSADHADFDHLLAKLYIAQLTATPAATPHVCPSAPRPRRCGAGGMGVVPDGLMATGEEAARHSAEGLLTLIRKSEHLDASELQRLMPRCGASAWDFGRVRAALHERLGEYQAAMDVFVRELRDPVEAEAYADRLRLLLVRTQADPREAAF
jgi:hypothetical protein